MLALFLNFQVNTHTNVNKNVCYVESGVPPVVSLSSPSSDGVGVAAGVAAGVAEGVVEGVAEGVAAGVTAGVALAGSSVLHLFTFPKVIRALSTWKSGISEGGMRKWIISRDIKPVSM